MLSWSAILDGFTRWYSFDVVLVSCILLRLQRVSLALRKIVKVID